MITMEPGKRYTINEINDIYNYVMLEKQKVEAINTLNDILKEKPNISITMCLAGNKYNYEWTKKQLNIIIEERRKIMEANEKITDKDDEYYIRYNRVIDNYNSSINNLNKNIKEYEKYYEDYNTYDMIIFTLTE